MSSMDSSHSTVARFFRSDQFDPEASVTSWFVEPNILLIYRTIFAIYGCAVFVAEIVHYVQLRDVHLLNYFTYLNYLGLTVYFITSALYSSRYIYSHRLGFPKPLNYIFWILYHTLCHYNLLVPIVYWTFLSSDLIDHNNPPIEWWRETSVHGLSAAMMYVELFLGRQIMVWPMIIICEALIVLYMFEAFVVYAIYHFWTYSFLEWSRGPSAAYWYVGLFIFFTLAYMVQMAVHKFRDWIGEQVGYVHAKEETSDIQEMRLSTC